MQSARELHDAIAHAIDRRDDVRLERHPLHYRAGAWELVRVASASIGTTMDRVLLIQAGIHGDEIAGPITLARHLDQIFDRAHRANLELIIYPLANPSGFDRQTRYGADHREGDPGNADFLRYELEDGRLLDELPTGATFRCWSWSSDQVLPPETRLLHQLLKKDPLDRVRAVLDLHQDRLTEGAPPAAYHYAFGDFARYRSIIDRLRVLVPLFSNRAIDAGYAQSKEPPPMSDADGFILRHDGSLTDLFHRLGAEHAITVETTGATPLDVACRVNLTWIEGVIDLLA